MHPIEYRIVVLEKQDSGIYYCHKMHIPLNEFYGYFNDKFIMCRILSYEKDTRTLYLRTEGSGTLGKDQYNINSGVNDEIFKDNPVKTIVLNRATSQPFLKKNTAPQETKGRNISDDSEEILDNYLELMGNKGESDERNIEFKLLKPLVEFTFNDAYMSFEGYCSEIKKIGVFNIENNFIKSEYDSIKNYFSKFFNKGKVEVVCRLKVSNSDILETSASSEDIPKINQDTITQIEDNLIRDSILNKETEEIKSLEDAFNDTYQELEDKQVEWLMSKLANSEITKHHRHLLYLSDRHDNSIFKLKVTGKPVSFLFGIRENNNIYIVWETHNTKEATYIWKHNKSDNELQEFISDIDEQVKKLRQRTKREYRSHNKDNPNFSVIEHEYNSDDYGFEKWKANLESYLSL